MKYGYEKQYSSMNTKIVYSLGSPIFVMSCLCFLTVDVKLSQSFSLYLVSNLKIVTMIQSIAIHAEL